MYVPVNLHLARLRHVGGGARGRVSRAEEVDGLQREVGHRGVDRIRKGLAPNRLL